MSKKKRKYTRKTSDEKKDSGWAEVNGTPEPEAPVETVTETKPQAETEKPVVKSFLQPQIVSPKHKDFLAVFDENGRHYNKRDHFIAGKYNLRWKSRGIINTGREGIWAVMPKDHEEFKGKVFVLRDDSPNENYFQYESLVLCVCRRESLDSQRENIRLRSKEALEGSKVDVRAGIERIVRETKPGAINQIRPIG